MSTDAYGKRSRFDDSAATASPAGGPAVLAPDPSEAAVLDAQLGHMLGTLADPLEEPTTVTAAPAAAASAAPSPTAAASPTPRPSAPGSPAASAPSPAPTPTPTPSPTAPSPAPPASAASPAPVAGAMPSDLLDQLSKLQALIAANAARQTGATPTGAPAAGAPAAGAPAAGAPAAGAPAAGAPAAGAASAAPATPSAPHTPGVGPSTTPSATPSTAPGLGGPPVPPGVSVGTLRRFAAALAQHRLGGVSRGKRLMFGALFVAGLASAGAYALRSSGPAAPAKGGRGAAAATAAGAGAGAAVTLPPGTPLVVDDAYAIVRQVAHAPGDFAMAGAIRGGPEYVQGVLAAERLVFDRLLLGVQDPEARLGIVDAEVSRAFALRDPERLRTALEHVKLIDPHVQDARTMAALSRGHFALAKLLKGQGLAERQARVQGVLFGEQFKRVMQHPDGRAFHGAGWTPALAEQVRASLVSVMSTRASVAGHPREYAVGYLDGLNEAIKAYNAQYGLLRLRVGVRARR